VSEIKHDTLRALAAAKKIIDGRDAEKDLGAILVTTEHAVAAILLTIMGSPDKAAKMLNEGLVQGIEERLSLYASKDGGK